MTMTETEMAKELGYDRIWDCGLIKYVYRNPDYVEENVSTKVVKIIQSYVGIVNKMVWRKF